MKRWVIISPLPPPQDWDSFHHYYRAVSNFYHESPLLHSRFCIHIFVFFWIPIFVFFWKKTEIFWIYTTTQCFIKIVQKIDFTSWNTILWHFFKKKQGRTLRFFFYLIKIHDLWILMKMWKKTKGTTLFF